MLCAAATQGTVRLVRHGVRGLIDAVVKTDEEAPRVLWMDWRLTTRSRVRSGLSPAGGCRPDARCRGLSRDA
jgi:hypothetical protein